MNAFNDLILGEPEQDANSALTELDKGLRSGKVGEQCEAIVRFPRLFEKYPFPILINSSFLKLADVFRLGNNFLRLWVLRVCQQSEKHLDKILNVDEFVRRVYSVLHSNDPVARALTLQTLGAVAGIICDRQNAHHAIRLGLDSHDTIEVDAAIYATTQFAAHSNTFAASMCNKLSDMVVCESTCSERRVKLIRALRHVHGGAIKAQSVLTLLRGLVIRYPAEATTCAAISALTAIASDTVVHIPDQVWLLLQAARSAKRNVRVAALLGLRRLAHFATLWPADAAIKELPLVASAHDHTQLEMCLQVMQILVHSPAICAAVMSNPQVAEDVTQETSSKKGLRSLCSSAVNSMNLGVASRAANVLTNITIYCYKENLSTENVKELLFALESLVIITGVEVKPSNPEPPENLIRPLRLALKCLVDLCAVDDTHSKRVARVLALQLRSLNLSKKSADTLKRANALLEGLGALGGAPNGALSLLPILPSMVTKLKEAAQLLAASISGTEEVKMDIDAAESSPVSTEDNQLGTVIVLLCTLLIQAASGATIQRPQLKINGNWKEGVKSIIHNLDGWTRYRVARAAMRYGQHELAAAILEQLLSESSSEWDSASLQWCTAVKLIAQAEAGLQNSDPAPHNIMNALDNAISLHYKALAQLKAGACGCAAAGGSGEGRRCSRCGWALGRALLLGAARAAGGGARALCSAPPAAVAAAGAAAQRDAAAAAGAAAAALRRARRRAADAARRRAAQAEAAFRADDADLRHLRISQYSCEQLARLLDKVASPNYQDRLEPWVSQQPFIARSLEESLLLKPCEEIDNIAKKLFDGRDGGGQGITHRHAEATMCAVRWHACAPWARARGARGGDGAGARCRLALSPAPRAPLAAAPPAAGAAPPAPPQQPDAHVPVPQGHHFALKIEGVIQRDPVNKRRKVFERDVKSVQLTITATPLAKANDKFACDQNPPIITAIQIVTPLRDFFSAQQLLALSPPSAGIPGVANSPPNSGLYNVVVEAAFVDDEGEIWNTGPKASVTVKVHEDLTTKTSNNQANRGRF